MLFSQDHVFRVAQLQLGTPACRFFEISRMWSWSSNFVHPSTSIRPRSRSASLSLSNGAPRRASPSRIGHELFLGNRLSKSRVACTVQVIAGVCGVRELEESKQRLDHQTGAPVGSAPLLRSNPRFSADLDGRLQWISSVHPICSLLTRPGPACPICFGPLIEAKAFSLHLPCRPPTVLPRVSGYSLPTIIVR